MRSLCSVAAVEEQHAERRRTNGAAESAPAKSPARGGSESVAAREEEARRLREEVAALQKAVENSKALASKREGELNSERTKSERALVSQHSSKGKKRVQGALPITFGMDIRDHKEALS